MQKYSESDSVLLMHAHDGGSISDDDTLTSTFGLIFKQKLSNSLNYSISITFLYRISVILHYRLRRNVFLDYH